MGISTISVMDEQGESYKMVTCFADNINGFYPITVPLSFVQWYWPLDRNISIGQGATAGVSTEQGIAGYIISDCVLAAQVANASPPVHIDFFLQVRDSYNTFKKMVLPLGRSFLMNPAMNAGTDRVYSSLKFQVPTMEAWGHSVSPYISIAAELPAAWGEASALVIKAAVLGVPGIPGP